MCFLQAREAGRQLRPAGLQEAVELPGRPLLGLVHMVVVVVLLGRLGSPKRPGVVAAPASVLVNGDAEAAAVEARRAEPFAAVDAGPQVAFERRRRPSTASPATVAARHAAEQQARPTEERARAARGEHARPTLSPGPQRWLQQWLFLRRGGGQLGAAQLGNILLRAHQSVVFYGLRNTISATCADQLEATSK